MAGMRRLAVAQVREAVGLPATDTVQSGTTEASTPAAPTITPLATAVIDLTSQALQGLRGPT